ncbi:YEL025C [Zygosaccharomyces parabailii]|nr:YEL025C [Zygosaccharomyces parabailii]CDH16572.1 uncharacterized protein ZBAI_08360 [Zygosaccharomyces bailii ISA1307]
MDGLFFLHNELNFRKEGKQYVNSRLSLLPHRKTVATRFVNYMVLEGQKHLLCTNRCFYIFQKDQMLVKHFFEPGFICHAYLFVESFNSFAAHIFMMNDGSIQIFRHQGPEMNLVECIDCSKVHRNDKLSLMTSSDSGISFSVDSQRICLWNIGIQYSQFYEIYTTQTGEILYYNFMEGNMLICICKNLFTGELFIEYAISLHPNVFETTRRCYLDVSDVRNILVRKLDNTLLVCITPEETWYIKLNKLPFRRKNLGLSKKLHLLNMEWDIEKDLMKLYASGDVFLTSYSQIFNAAGPLKWSFSSIKKLLRRHQYENVDFIYGIQEGMYILFSTMSGVQIVDVIKKTAANIIACEYESKKYFDGHVALNRGTDLDSLLLCGAYSEFLGVFERQVYQYPHQILSTQSLDHKPVMNIWSTQKGIFYESMGMVYNGSSVESFQNGLWVSKNGTLIRDDHNDVVFITSYVAQDGKDMEYLLEIHENGKLDVISVNQNQVTEKVLVLEIGSRLENASVISAFYDATAQQCYAITCSDYRTLNLYCNNVQISQILVEADFDVVDLNIRINANRLLIIATSSDGKMRIYSALKKIILLEIVSDFECQLNMVDMQDFFLFYSLHEVILVEMKSLIYGRLALPMESAQIIPCDGHRFHVLDSNWNLNLVEFSQQPILGSFEHEFPGFIPLKMELLPTRNLAIIVLKSSLHEKLKIILFDYMSAKVLKTQEWKTSCSNVLLECVCGYIILYYCDKTLPTYRIFNYSLELFTSDNLPFPATSMSVCLDTRQVKFLGSRSMIYDILLGVNSISLKLVDCVISKISPHNRYTNEHSTKFVRWGQVSKQNERLSDVEILEDFMTPGGTYQNDICRLFTNYYNEVYAKDFQKKLTERILSVRALPVNHRSIQLGTQRLVNTQPVFLITCSDSALYLLTATIQN